MNKPADLPPDVDPLTRQAIAWLVRLKSGEATTADAAEFRRWRSESPEHEAALKKAVRLWQSFGKVATQNSAIQPSSRPAATIAFFPRTATRRALLGGAIAAGAAGYLLTRPPLGLWPSLEELSADYRTGKGEQLKVALKSGISLKLGTLTSIAVETVATETKVELIDGEAAFTSSASPGQRLVVVAAGGIITAESADFDARCIDGVVSVTCASGNVGVRRAGQSVGLMPGQQVSYSHRDLGGVLDVDLDKATSWRSGVLIFTDKPLGEVVEEINRYLPGHIFIVNGALRARVVNGTFHREQLSNFVDQVKLLFGAKATVLPGGVTLLS